MSYILLPVMPFRISTIIKCSTELVDNVFIHNDITLHLIFWALSLEGYFILNSVVEVLF